MLTFGQWLSFMLVLTACSTRWSAPKDLPPGKLPHYSKTTDFSRCPGDGRPLPYVGHWNMGTEPGGFSPSWQLGELGRGEFLWPWFALPSPSQNEPTQKEVAYYSAAIRYAAKHHLPLAFVSTQWESMLTADERFAKLPADVNPNVVTATGQVLPEVSPFGTEDVWRDVGMQWTTGAMLRLIQAWYPDPPLVLFVSNNEHAKLRWQDLDSDFRALQQPNLARDPVSKKRFIGDRWIRLYRALQEGMKQGLQAAGWKGGARFIGYGAFGTSSLGRWYGWSDYALNVPGRFDPRPLMWDGASLPYYLNRWSGIADTVVFSPQIEAMNWVFMLRLAEQAERCFFLEISTWDGERRKSDVVAQSFDPPRYEGFVQFGMWLLRPRIVREFRGWRDTVDMSAEYFAATERAVGRVHNQHVLQEFWGHGELVPNPDGEHPYQTHVPEDVKSYPRWFLLKTNIDPPRPWALATEIPVFALALKEETNGAVKWLVYAHSPKIDRVGVELVLPGYGTVKMDVRRSGTFVLVDGRTHSVTPQE